MSEADKSDLKSTASGRIRIGDLLLDSGQRRVWRGDQEIELPKRSFDMLAALASAAPNSLSIDELIDGVWKGAVVSSATVAKRVELLRHALGDKSDDSRYIALVRGHGYRLIPDVVGDDIAAKRQLRLRWPVAILVVALTAAAWLLWPDPEPPENSLAVLPFVAVSGSDAETQFAQGLAEQLMHTLASTGDIKVSGRTSSFQFDDATKDVGAIGRALEVAHVLEGSVAQDDDKIRITARLVSTTSGFQSWSEIYERSMSDVVEIQQDIARSVSQQLQSSLAASLASDSKSATDSAEAYALYLKAVALAPYPWTPSTPQAQPLLERAVALDPDFADAWALLAAVHGRRIIFRDPTYELSPAEGLQAQEHALQRALAIDPNNSSALATQAGMAWIVGRDLQRAAHLIERAVQNDPWNLDILSFAASFASHIGRFEEAVLLEQRLVDRDPLCDTCRQQLARTYTFLHRFADAEREIRTLKAVHDGGYNWSLGVLKLLQGAPKDALRFFSSINPDGPFGRIGQALVHHDLGQTEEARRLLDAHAAPLRERGPIVLAKAFAYVGDADKALFFIRQSLQTNPQGMVVEFPDPMFDSLRDDPRWNAILSRVGVAPDQLAEISFQLNTVLQ